MHTSIKNANHYQTPSLSKEIIDYYEEIFEKNKLVMEASFEAIVCITIQGQIVVWNTQASKILGWIKDEIIGLPLHTIIAKQSHSQLKDIFTDCITPNNNSIQRHQSILHAIDQFKKEFPIEFNMARVRHGEHEFYTTFIKVIKKDHAVLSSNEKSAIEKEHFLKQKEITSAVISSQEMERSIIGQELHDNVNQILTTVKLYNEMLLDGIGEPQAIIKKSVYHLQNCINEIRSISKRLSAPTLGKISLQDTLKELVESINLTKRINIVYTIDGFSSRDTSQEIHLGIYRIVQEHLNNIINYSAATFATITIIRDQKKLSLIMHDDGNGFDQLFQKNAIGITNMKTRAENLNGTFMLSNNQGVGCKLEVKIPF